MYSVVWGGGNTRGVRVVAEMREMPLLLLNSPRQANLAEDASRFETFLKASDEKATEVTDHA